MAMKRRDFIKRTAPAALPLLFGGFGLKAFARTPFNSLLAEEPSSSDRVVVMIYLKGGNDGLNTVIPIDGYGAYAGVRPTIAIDRDAILPLTGSTGLHPAMKGLRNLYEAGKLCVVQGVGYENLPCSHAAAEMTWFTQAMMVPPQAGWDDISTRPIRGRSPAPKSHIPWPFDSAAIWPAHLPSTVPTSRFHSPWRSRSTKSWLRRVAVMRPR
ncbi:MAG TPA: hypothetical protein VHI13_22625 [Candidatus Kapabacteria bacterium]|nr:hypothetical protein [Candidatus Kapabacteria bacterium]